MNQRYDTVSGLLERIRKYVLRLFSTALHVDVASRVEENTDRIQELAEKVEDMTRHQEDFDDKVSRHGDELSRQKDRLRSIETTVRALKAQAGVEIVPRRQSASGADTHDGKHNTS